MGWNMFRKSDAGKAPEQKASATGRIAAMASGSGRVVWSPRDTGSLTRQGFTGNPIGFRCVKMIAEAAAALPLVLLMFAPSGESGNAGWAAMLWFLVFLLFPFFNKDSMRAGDLIAGTWVLEAPKQKLAVTLSTEGAVSGGSSDLTGAAYKFGDDELSVYGEYELQTLERVLRDGRPEAMEAVAETICAKIGWNAGAGDEQAFLEAFYGQLRARLETNMRFGNRKADKFS